MFSFFFLISEFFLGGLGYPEIQGNLPAEIPVNRVHFQLKKYMGERLHSISFTGAS